MATSDLERFFGYVRAFELAFVTGAWSGLEPWFADDARHVVQHGGPFGDGATGRARVIDDLRASTARVDARFDVRIPEIVAGPITRPDGVWMRWAMTMRRAGLPDMRVEGEHLTKYDPASGRIAAIEERLDPATAPRVAAYLAQHGDRLRPEASPFDASLSAADARDLETAIGRSLARCYGHAKSEQDIGAALAVCSDDFVLDTPCLGVTARGRREAEAQLAVFFTAFPDYGVKVEGVTADPTSVACWGIARMRFGGPLLGLPPTGKTAEVPFVSIFPLRGGALAGEKFFFDLATLCAQIDLPLEALLRAVAPLQPSRAGDALGTSPSHASAGPPAASL
jgi:steroid delta-isomerase-like uncharacterized protein